MRREIRSKLCNPDQTTLAEMIEQADDVLFPQALSKYHHVLHFYLINSKKTCQLRHRRHNLTLLRIFSPNTHKKPKVLPEPKGPLGGADLRFNSPQPDTSRSCKSTDTGLVCRVECLFKIPACSGTDLLLGEQRQCVNNLPKVEREAPRESNLRPHGYRSDVLTTTLPRHNKFYY